MPVADEGWGEHKDGVDTAAWIVDQPWCNGKIVTCGISYLGATQYAMWLSGEDVPGLETSVIYCPAINNYDGGWVYAQDFLDASAATYWPVMMTAFPSQFERFPEDVKKEVAADLERIGNPLMNPELLVSLDYYRKLQSEYSYKEMPAARFSSYYNKWLDNRENPDFFSYCTTSTRKHDFKKPILFQAGWYDAFIMNILNAYTQSVTDAPSEEIAKGHRLIVGAWAHNYSPTTPLRRFPESETDHRLFDLEWFEQNVNGIPSEFFEKNRVSLFVMGENRWRSEPAWPIADEKRTRYYLHSAGAANTRLGNGSLSLNKPGQEATDNYQYDPADPVCSLGGTSVLAGGMADQRNVELRPDVLVYTTPELQEDVEVTGTINGVVYAATSAEDTDFFMTLLDVCPDGNVYNVVQGGRRGRYIKNGRSNPEALIPGEINAFEIDLYATSYVFKKGHQIRVEVTSSSAFLRDVNPNAFVDLNTCTKDDYVVAAQTVYHDEDYASYIELPVIPESHERNWLDWPFDSSITGVETVARQMLPALEPYAVYDGSELQK